MKNSTIILSIFFCFLINFQESQAQAQTELDDLNTMESNEAKNIKIDKNIYKELVQIAINSNKEAIKIEHKKLRCQYLNELNFLFEFDIEDVEGNIRGFERWNPKILTLIEAIQNDKLLELDSKNNKMATTTQFKFFNQRTKTKLEQLSHSNIDLVGNSTLKNMLF